MVLNESNVQFISWIKCMSMTHHTLASTTFLLPPPVLHLGELTRLLQF
jgi:hypothetical protein